MKNCDSKLQKSACGSNPTDLPNTLHAARSPSTPDAAIRFVTNLAIRRISAGITVVLAAPAWPLAAVRARRRRTLRKRGNQNKTDFVKGGKYFPKPGLNERMPDTRGFPVQQILRGSPPASGCRL